MASLDDILTTQKNGVIAINGYADTLKRLAGTTNALEVSAQTVIKTSGGWLASISIITAGATTTYFYDANLAAGIVNGRRIYAVPSTVGVGVYQVQIPFLTGLAIVPGTSAVITVNYS